MHRRPRADRVPRCLEGVRGRPDLMISRVQSFYDAGQLPLPRSGTREERS